MTALQEDRITALCEQLKLARLAAEWPALAQHAARTEASFADFLESVLGSEIAARDERRTIALMRLATMPAIKTLEQFDWSHAGGAPKAQITELAHLAFVPRAENVDLPAKTGSAMADLQSATAALAGQWGLKQLIDMTDTEARDDLARLSATMISIVAQSAFDDADVARRSGRESDRAIIRRTSTTPSSAWAHHPRPR